MAVVAVTGTEVDVRPAEPVEEFAGLTVRCSALEVEDEGLWGGFSRLLRANERLREVIGNHHFGGVPHQCW